MRMGLALGLWLAGAVVASISGWFRNTYLTPRLGEHRAHVLGTVIFIAVVLLLSWAYAHGTRGPGWAGAAWRAGALWLLLTVGFEFLAGHYLFRNPWSRLIADYKIWQGRVWPLVLLTLLVGPALMGRLLSRTVSLH